MQNERRTLPQKFITVMVVIILTISNLLFMGNSLITYAEGNLENQNERTSNANVEFEAYFVKDENKIHSITLDAKNKEKLYIRLSIKKEGYLKSGIIKLKDTNYSVEGKVEGNGVIASIENDELKLKQINSGTEAVLQIPIELKKNEKIDISDLDKTSKAILNCIYVDNSGKEVNIEKEVQLNVKLTQTSKPEAKSEFVAFQKINEKSFLQEKIEIETDEKIIPIEKTEIKINVPTIKDKNPVNVNVLSIKTLMTNGKEYTNDGVKTTYDKSTGNLEINIANDKTGNIVYAGDGKDEILVTYEYDFVADGEYTATSKSKILVQNYGAKKEEILEKDLTNEKNIKEEYGKLSHISLACGTINKAKMYANANNEIKNYETEYFSIENIAIAEIEGIEEIEISYTSEEFLDENNEKYSTKVRDEYYTYYKETKVSKDCFNKIFGQDGQIEIENENGEVIGKINASSEVIDKYYTVKYGEQYGKITLKTSRPISEGHFDIAHTKAIKADLPYSKEKIESFKLLEETVEINGLTKQEKIETNETQNLEEATSNLKIKTNKEVLNKKVEEVELKVEFGNNREDSILYEEPSVIITLPEFVEKVEVLNSNLLLEDELEIKDIQVGSVDGNRAVKVDLTGTQTHFNNIKNGNGTTLVLGAKLTNKLETGEGTITANVQGYRAETNLASTLEPKEEQLGEDPEIPNDEDQGNDTNDIDPNSCNYENGEVLQNSDDDESIVIRYASRNADDEMVVEITTIDIDRVFNEEDEFSYKIEVFNVKDTGLQDVVVKTLIPSEFTYIESKSSSESNEGEIVSFNTGTRELAWNIDSLTEGRSLEIFVRANKLDDSMDSKEIPVSVTGYYDNENKSVNSGNLSLFIEKNIENVITEIVDAKDIYQMGDTFPLQIKIEKISGRKREVGINVSMPRELLLEKYSDGTSAELHSKVANITGTTIRKGETYTATLQILVEEFDMNEDETSREVNFSININGTDYPLKINVAKKIYEEGKEEIPDITPTPTPVENTPTPTPTGGQTEHSDPTATPKGQVDVTPTPTPTPSETNPGESTPTPTPNETIPGDNTPTPTPKGGQKEQSDPTQKEDDKQEQTYSISGSVWLDANKNGIKNSDEETLKEVEVRLLDEKENIVQTVKTDKDGKYIFSKIKPGKYLVNYEFNENEYELTDYLKTKNPETNSSVIKSKKSNSAISNVLTVTNYNIQNINIGLIKIPKFDMSLKKTVNKIIVQNSEGSKSVEYGNQLAKIDIKGKLLTDSVVLVEYKIEVKNEGEITGNVREIIDYKPKDMTFSTDLNKSWVQGADGNLYNMELKDIEIKPGETKEILLILTKNMTETNTGLSHNTAELSVVENDQNRKDIDSTPKNRVEGEDDMSSADVLIGVQTGIEIAYTILGIILIIVAITGILLINLKVLGTGKGGNN